MERSTCPGRSEGERSGRRRGNVAFGLCVSSPGLVPAELGELLALLGGVLSLAAEACPASSGRAEKERSYISWFLDPCVSRGPRDKNGTHQLEGDPPGFSGSIERVRGTGR